MNRRPSDDADRGDLDQRPPGKRRDLLHALADVAAAALDGDPDAERTLHALLGPRWRQHFANVACA